MVWLPAPEALFSIDPHNRFARPCEFGYGVFGYTKFGDEFLGVPMEEFGASIYGDLEFGDYILLSGIYAHRRTKSNRGTIRMHYYRPKNPHTIPQNNVRDKFAAAVLAWQNLTISQKAVYNKKAVGRHQSGYNLKIAEFMSS